ncbi:hypothetical protein PS683_04190 [Pseudomonas fluorescens]|uniref:Uncharacterized protein n=1 Tax=Pseudomonas fluorescens TaxID=294 RepID=A0A5E6MWU3_PSEFL|nr:hypothetical protein PS683_04190 [Pseudomonas fluorescens]VVN17633.1 hypothetical protein PS683_04190 [Pseudomonas fluorescens]
MRAASNSSVGHIRLPLITRIQPTDGFVAWVSLSRNKSDGIRSLRNSLPAHGQAIRRSQAAGCSERPEPPSDLMQFFLLESDAVHYADWDCEPLNICFEGFATVPYDSAGHTPAETHSPADVVAQDDFPELVVVIETCDLSPVGVDSASNDSFRCQAENFYLVFSRAPGTPLTSASRNVNQKSMLTLPILLMGV